MTDYDVTNGEKITHDNQCSEEFRPGPVTFNWESADELCHGPRLIFPQKLGGDKANGCYDEFVDTADS